MPELRKDPVVGRWVIIATDRARRPSDWNGGAAAGSPGAACPFCPGNERFTPHEVMAIREGGAGANGPGWSTRVVPNKFPALQIEGGLDRRGEGMYDRMNGVGAHEVIIESPDHSAELSDLSLSQIERVLRVYRDRILDLKNDIRFRYILVFKNHGAAAGATLEHSHSQLIALPIVPDFVREEIDGARRHYASKERCVFCDIIRQETQESRRVIAENADMVAVAPYAPRFPFETWILPKRHQASFEEAPRHEYAALGRLLGDILRRMNTSLRLPPYNLLIHSAPLHEPAAADFYHWHVEIIPTLTRVAGFEWATGFYVNPTSPEEAAEVLRELR